MSQKLAGVKGMNDLLPGEVEVWQHVERTAREIFAGYGFGELRTPMLEDTALFVRGVGEGTDLVGKEMYTFEDKGGRSLSLRPEGTAPAARAYIEHAVLNTEPVTRWFYLGPMFRYERMKTGRYRQFSQIGAEAYGVQAATQDVELIEMVVHFLGKLGLTGISLNLNSIGDDACRPTYTARLVEYFGAHRDELCEDCKQRLEHNPLRVLDCKNPRCQELGRGAPNVLESLCAPCRDHFEAVQRGLRLLEVPFELNPRMVRGLDYYTRTAFEFIASDPSLGTASAVGGGGRYDKLVKSLGGPEVPAVGFGLGLDRICLLLAASGQRFSTGPDLFVVTVDEPAQDEALRLITHLRHQGLKAELDTRGGSVKSQMKRADKTGARFTLVLGADELKTRSGKLKRMADGQEQPVALDQLVAALQG